MKILLWHLREHPVPYQIFQYFCSETYEHTLSWISGDLWNTQMKWGPLLPPNKPWKTFSFYTFFYFDITNKEFCPYILQHCPFSSHFVVNHGLLYHWRAPVWAWCMECVFGLWSYNFFYFFNYWYNHNPLVMRYINSCFVVLEYHGRVFQMVTCYNVSSMRQQCLFWSLMYPKHLKACLTHYRCSIFVFKNEIPVVAS